MAVPTTRILRGLAAELYWSVRFAVMQLIRWLQVAVPALVRRAIPVALAITALVFAMDGQWTTARTAAAQPLAADLPTPTSSLPTPNEGGALVGKKKLTGGKVNLNTATEQQLMQLPTVGPAKAERVITWRKKNGGFKRIADIRRVKGFGYKTFKRLEPYLDIAGPTTLTTQ